MPSIYQWKKWIKRYLLKNKKALMQGVGQFYSVNEIKGYYNDLREKVVTGPSLADYEIPQYYQDNGEKFTFSIGVMQYGLASYDLFLEKGEQKHLNKMFLCSDRDVSNKK